jgi:hypothetical protein
MVVRATVPFLSVSETTTKFKPIMTGHLTCCNCGHFSGNEKDDVTAHLQFVNGSFKHVPLCVDAMACYHRRKAHFADSEVD